jgi:hypothetical protein
MVAIFNELQFSDATVIFGKLMGTGSSARGMSWLISSISGILFDLKARRNGTIKNTIRERGKRICDMA